MADHHGVKSGISTHLEFSVVLIEAVLLLGFAIPLWAKRVNQFPDTKDAILVHAVGQQFNWTYHLPGGDGQFGRRDVSLVTNQNPVGLDYNDPASKDDIIALGELHIPVNRPVIIELSSKDVIHNFNLTNMRIAQDAIPGSIIPMWFKPIKTGTYEVICGQLCGLGHYSMTACLKEDTGLTIASMRRDTWGELMECAVNIPLVNRSNRRLSLRRRLSCLLSATRGNPVIGMVPTVRIR